MEDSTGLHSLGRSQQVHHVLERPVDIRAELRDFRLVTNRAFDSAQINCESGGTDFYGLAAPSRARFLKFFECH